MGGGKEGRREQGRGEGMGRGTEGRREEGRGGEREEEGSGKERGVRVFATHLAHCCVVIPHQQIQLQEEYVPAFFISLVSCPAYTTTPTAHLVLRSLQPYTPESTQYKHLDVRVC